MSYLAFLQNQETPDFATLIAIAAAIGVIIFVVIPILLMVRRTRRDLAQRQALLISGESAQAKILRLWDTGMTYNDNPQVRVLLEVYPPDGAAYQVETKCIISRLSIPQVQPGNIVAVKIDSQDEFNIALDIA